MANNRDNRVLSRQGARELTQQEVEGVSGGLIPTLASLIITGALSHPDNRLDT